MHKMEQTPKVVTIVGLALEGLGGIGMFFVAVLFKIVLNKDFFLELDPDIDVTELNMILDIYNVVGTIMIVMGVIILTFFIINLYLFIKLMNGGFDEEAALKVYKYQFVWGIISIFLNTIVGILYIVSAVQGKNGQVDRIETRNGI